MQETPVVWCSIPAVHYTCYSIVYIPASTEDFAQRDLIFNISLLHLGDIYYSPQFNIRHTT